VTDYLYILLISSVRRRH